MITECKRRGYKIGSLIDEIRMMRKAMLRASADLDNEREITARLTDKKKALFNCISAQRVELLKFGVIHEPDGIVEEARRRQSERLNGVFREAIQPEECEARAIVLGEI